MTTENTGEIVSREAGTNVTNMRFVKDAAGGVVNRTTVEGEKVSGVVAAKYLPINAASQAIATGDPAPVCKSGIVLVEAGGVLADLGEVMTDNQGRAIAFDDNIAKYAVGKVVSSSAAQAGDIVAVELYALDAQRKGATP